MTRSALPPVEKVDPVLPTLSSSWLKKVVFLGTGTSGQVPAIHCVTSPDPKGCETCEDAQKPDSKNRRGCTSVAVVGRDKGDDQDSTILIDCGKTFYSSALSLFPSHGIRKLKAVFLTHAHADATLGLDDLRAWTMGGVIQSYVDIYLTIECMQTVQGMFPYLVDRTKSTGGGDVGMLRWHVIDPLKEVTIGGATVRPLPVLHGFIGKDRTPFPTLGYKVEEFAYISDCHHIPASTVALLKETQLFVLDALKMDKHASHFSFSQALSFLASMPVTPPKLALLTDVTHRVEHYRTQEMVGRWRTGLMNWQAKTGGNVDGVGEAGGPRWWQGAWDEERCERELTVRLEDSGETSDDIGDWSHVSYHIPSVYMAYDGLAVEFSNP